MRRQHFLSADSLCHVIHMRFIVMNNFAKLSICNLYTHSRESKTNLYVHSRIDSAYAQINHNLKYLFIKIYIFERKSFYFSQISVEKLFLWCAIVKKSEESVWTTATIKTLVDFIYLSNAWSSRITKKKKK